MRGSTARAKKDAELDENRSDGEAGAQSKAASGCAKSRGIVISEVLLVDSSKSRRVEVVTSTDVKLGVQVGVRVAANEHPEATRLDPPLPRVIPERQLLWP